MTRKIKIHQVNTRVTFNISNVSRLKFCRLKTMKFFLLFTVFLHFRLDWKSMCIEIWIPKLLKELKKKKEEFASCSYISYFWCNILELILFCLLNFSSLGLFSVFCKFLFLHTCLHYIPTCFYPPLPCPCRKICTHPN